MSTVKPSLNECKIQASRLIKALRSDDSTHALAAAERFQCFSEFADSKSEEIVAQHDRIKLKHAFEVIAREYGERSWKRLKDSHDNLWYPPCGGFLNHWYATYAEARAHCDEHGGYLLTDHGKYFVCGRLFIENLGLEPDDPRWEAIGYDVAKPRDKQAFEELVAQLRDQE